MERKEKWTVVRKDGKKVEFTCVQISPQRAQMTAQVEGEETHYLERTGLTVPLTREDVEKEFSPQLRGVA